MTDLTEQWKKGELPEGHYYVRDGENMIAEYLDEYFYNNGEPMTSFTGGVDEVLDKVPSYEEWQASYNCMLENEVLRLKNAQLKELLEECKEMLKKSITYQCMDRANHYIKKIENDIYEQTLAKINEALK